MKTASFYRSKPSELDKSLLHVIPDAPRVPHSSVPPHFDWSMFEEEGSQRLSNVCFTLTNIRKAKRHFTECIFLFDFFIRIILLRKAIQHMKNLLEET